jgi:Meiotically up-regulated gene 113
MGEALIYFVQAVDGGPIKIGIAVDVDRRLRQLQTGSPVRLRVTRTMTGGAEKEVALHQRFKSNQLWGEWFAATPELARLARAQRASNDDGADAGEIAAREAGHREGYAEGYTAAEQAAARRMGDLEDQLEAELLGVEL